MHCRRGVVGAMARGREWRRCGLSGAQPAGRIMSHATASTSMAYVYDGRACVGFVLARGRAGFQAFDREQGSLGLFQTAAAAANVAFDNAANEEGAGWRTA